MTVKEQIQRQMESFRLIGSVPEGHTLVIGLDAQKYVMIKHDRLEVQGVAIDRFYWAGNCAVCRLPILLNTGLEFDYVARCCPDHWGQYKEADVIRKRAEANERSRVSRDINKLGSIERHILETIELNFPDFSRVSYDSLVDTVVHAMPQEEGKRDTRENRVIRAIEALAKMPDGPLSVRNGQVTFYV